MITGSDFNRLTALRPLILFATLCALLQIASGCAFRNRVQTPRSSWEQILATTAIDRALTQVECPSGEPPERIHPPTANRSTPSAASVTRALTGRPARCQSAV
jgi:hypothetical protein